VIAISCVLTVCLSETAGKPVLVDDVPLVPQARLIFGDGTVIWNPYAAVGVGGGKTPDGSSTDPEVWMNGLLGSAVGWQPTSVDRVDLIADLQLRSSVGALKERDWNGNALLVGRHDGPAYWMSAEAEASSEDNFVPTLGGSLRTNSLYSRLNGTWISNNGGVEARLVGGREWHNGSSANRNRTIVSPIVHVFGTNGVNRLGISLRGDTVDYEEQTFYSSSQGGAVMARTELGVGNQSTLVADLGVAVRHYEQGAGDHLVTAPAVSISAIWNQPSGGSVTATASTVLDDNLAGNAEVFSSVSALVRLALAPPWQMFISALAGVGRDTGKPTGIVVEHRTEYEGRVGLEYHLPGDGSAIRLEASGEDYHADFAGDWQGARLELAYLMAW